MISVQNRLGASRKKGSTIPYQSEVVGWVASFGMDPRDRCWMEAPGNEGNEGSPSIHSFK